MQEQLLVLVQEAFEELAASGEQVPPSEHVSDIQLYGEDGIFTSMQLINFLAILEYNIRRAFGTTVSFTSEQALSAQIPPFSNTRSLVSFALQQLDASSAQSRA